MRETLDCAITLSPLRGLIDWFWSVSQGLTAGAINWRPSGPLVRHVVCSCEKPLPSTGQLSVDELATSVKCNRAFDIASYDSRLPSGRFTSNTLLAVIQENQEPVIRFRTRPLLLPSKSPSLREILAIGDDGR